MKQAGKLSNEMEQALEQSKQNEKVFQAKYSQAQRDFFASSRQLANSKTLLQQAQSELARSESSLVRNKVLVAAILFFIYSTLFYDI